MHRKTKRRKDDPAPRLHGTIIEKTRMPDGCAFDDSEDEKPEPKPEGDAT